MLAVRWGVDSGVRFCYSAVDSRVQFDSRRITMSVAGLTTSSLKYLFFWMLLAVSASQLLAAPSDPDDPDEPVVIGNYVFFDFMGSGWGSFNYDAQFSISRQGARNVAIYMAQNDATAQLDALIDSITQDSNVLVQVVLQVDELDDLLYLGNDRQGTYFADWRMAGYLILTPVPDPSPPTPMPEEEPDPLPVP